MTTELVFAGQGMPGAVAGVPVPVVPETEPPMDPLVQATALAGLLRERGFAVRVDRLQKHGAPDPCLTAGTGPGRHAGVLGRVYTGPSGEDGAWHFLFQAGSGRNAMLVPVAELADPEGAAGRLDELIACPGTAARSACPVCDGIARKAR